MKIRLHCSMLKPPLPSSLWGVPPSHTILTSYQNLLSIMVKMLKVTSKQIHCKNPSDKTSPAASISVENRQTVKQALCINPGSASQ